jgi:hypothetical protein
MENSIVTTPATEVVAPAAETPAKVTKPKRVIATSKGKAPKEADKPAAKVAAKAPKAVLVPTAKQAKAPAVHAHREAGVDTKSAYAGLSDMLNANRKVAVRVLPKRDVSTLTDRMRGTLYAIRKVYNGRSFPLKGLDNGVMAHLIAAGLIETSGGMKEIVDGGLSIQDGSTPAMGKITAAGLKHGVATAAPAAKPAKATA